MRRTWMFSPIFETRACRVASRDSPSTSWVMRSSTLSEPPMPEAAPATRSQYDRKVESFPTKSVSQLTSTMIAFPSLPELTAILPSAATRVAFLSACASPFLRRNSAAASWSPPDSVRAFLQSIMPAPVRSRRALMVLGVTAPPAAGAGAGASAAGAAASSGAAAAALPPDLRAAAASSARALWAARLSFRAAWVAANSSAAALTAAALAALRSAPAMISLASRSTWVSLTPKEGSTAMSNRSACFLILRIMFLRSFQLHFFTCSDEKSLSSSVSTISFVGLASMMAQTRLRRDLSPMLMFMVMPLAAPFWTAALRGCAGPKASVEVAMKAAKARELTIFILMCVRSGVLLRLLVSVSRECVLGREANQSRESDDGSVIGCSSRFFFSGSPTNSLC
mmetsp:Transcript_17845/g.41161  ORF Transcript_17845/g.41161 Transcript_17845/m.41161 type:complete len:396 (-) Transcript_17845:7-1194(-)